jgi:hypothetical protein
VGNTLRRLSFFVMVLAFSHQMFVEFTVSQTMEHFLACHEHAFTAFGGVPAKIMVNNLKLAMPDARMAQIPWLLVDGVLISPFPTRKGGPSASETAAIKAMRRRLMRAPIAVWIDSQDGRLTPQEIASGVLVARASAHAIVRMRTQ